MEKDYKKWSEIKSRVNDTELPETFHLNVGEVWWCSFGENVGIETDGKGEDYLRPALVVKFFNRNHIWVLPLTTSMNSSRFNIKVTSFSDSSFVIISQLRSISTKRFSRFITKIAKEDFLFIIENIINLLKYETPEQVEGISRPLGNNVISIADRESVSNKDKRKQAVIADSLWKS